MSKKEINFFFEDIESFVLDDFTVNWLNNSCIELVSLFKINYIFCSDEFLLGVNKEYLNHDYYTDVITFNNSDDDSVLMESDIFISVDRVKEHALERNIEFVNELSRVLIHGVLHLSGVDDKTPQQQEFMTKMEDKYLALHPGLN